MIPFASFWSWLLYALPGLLLGFGFGTSAAHVRFVRDPEAVFAERRGALQAERLERSERVGDDLHEAFTLHSSSGLDVRVSVLRPAVVRGENALAAVVLLGGLRTGRQAVELLPDSGGAFVVALDYPLDNPKETKGLALLPALPRVQRAIRDTPSALLLTVDWLAQRAEVDPERIELVGVSLGSFFTPVAGALDERVHRVWSMHGGGRVERLLEESLRERVPIDAVRGWTVRLAMVLGHGELMAPERWVHRIAPRRFVQVNGREDERIPRDSIQALFESAREPKEMVWLPGMHVEPDRESIVRALVSLVLERIRADEGSGPGAAR